MNELFTDLPESKSPRLIWMEKHGFTVTQTDAGDYIASLGAGCELGYGDCESEALRECAAFNNIPLWNEEGGAA